jgi:hypothetical protein
VAWSSTRRYVDGALRRHSLQLRQSGAAGASTFALFLNRGEVEFGGVVGADLVLRGVKAVVARSFVRIHRSNLVGMGVLRLQFKGGDLVEAIGIRSDEELDVVGLADVRPQMDVTLVIRRSNCSRREVPLPCRIDPPVEVAYYRHGGILPYVLRALMAG